MPVPVLGTTDGIEQHEPSQGVFDGTEPIEDGSVETRLAELDDMDLFVEGISPLHTGMLALAIAQYRQGIKEQPDGSNRGIPLKRYVRWFSSGSGPVPWCAYFVSWCLDRSTDSNRRVPWTNPGYVGSIHSWASGSSRLVRTPRTGDIFGLGDDHTGIVNDPDIGGGRMTTIEGNYSDAVSAVRRARSGLWFARI